MKLKKLVLIGGVVALGVAFVGTGTVKKGISYARQEVQSMVDKAGTPEREIERLREEVKKLDKVEKEMKDELAQQIVSCDRLAKATADLRTKVETERKDTLAFAETIRDSKNTQVSIGKALLSVDEAKRRLKADVSAVDKREKTVASMDTTLLHKEDAKKALTAQLTEIYALRLELTNDLDRIEAEQQALKLAGMKNKYIRDDAKWNNIREGIENLKQKLEVQRVRIGLDTGKGHIDTAIGESVDDILAPLNGKKAGSEKAGD